MIKKQRKRNYLLELIEFLAAIGILGNTVILMLFRNTWTYEELSIGEFAPTPKSSFFTIMHYNPVFTYIYIACGLIILLCGLYRLIKYIGSKHISK